MLRNYFIIAWRNLWNNKLFSLINILGLAIGMAAFLMILQYVNYEWSYDNFHPEGDRIYRIVNDYYKHDQLHSSHALSVGGVGTLIQNSVPEVQTVTRIKPFIGEGMVSNDSIRGSNSVIAPLGTIYFADSTFFEVFSFTLLKGKLNGLKNPDAIFISKSAAQVLFNSQNPIDKWLNIRNQGTNLSYFVAGVFEDLPGNSHIKIDYLLPLTGQGDWFVDDFGWSEFYTYIKLYGEQVPNIVANKITKVVAARKEFDPLYKGAYSQFFLQPINKIHLNVSYNNEPSETINPMILGLLIFAAFFILIIAYINYINMSINRSLSRAEEIGVRKVIGAGKPQLVGQFLLEALVVNLISIAAAILIIKVSAPYFQNLIAAPLPPLLSSWFGPVTLLSTLLLGTLLSGLYPAFMSSSLNLSNALKGKLEVISGGFGLRKLLIVIQFSTTLLLVIGSYAMYSQIRFMRTQELGFEVEQTLVLKRPLVTDSTYTERGNSFGQTLLQETFVRDFTAATSVPGRTIGWYTDGIQRLSNPDILLSSRMQSVDYNYVPSFDLKMIAGRNFDEQLDANQKVLLINETAVQHYGFTSNQEAVGSPMIRENHGIHTIVGVIADYHHESLRRAYQPTVYLLNARSPYFMAVKLGTINKENIATIQASWKQFFGDNPFSYFFLDDYFNQQYQSDIKFGEILGLFAILAMLVACMGLLALTTAMVQHRTKEIGVRKVLGANIAQILYLLSSDLVRLILIAQVIAIPLIYFGIREWLSDFAFQLDITIWIFAIPGILVLLLALLIVSIMSAKAALANPVDSLKTE